MNWKLKLLILLLSISASRCADDNDNGTNDVAKVVETTQKEIPHYNIVIVPDLSNRLDKKLYPRQLDDSSVYNVVLKLIPSLIKDHGKLAMQKDKFSLRLINSLNVPDFNVMQPKLTIDFGKFETKQVERIDYINNKGVKTINGDITEFKATAKKLYDEASTKGYTADIWGFFNQTLDGNYFKLSNPIENPNAKAKDVSKNILILVTDGYLDIKNQKESDCKDKICKWLTAERIDEFRTYYNEKGKGKELIEVFKNSGFGLTPVVNENLSNIEILMLEVYDRSKDKGGRITKQPSDFEILKLFWNDFFEKSGAKRFEIRETCSSEADLETILNSFIRKR